MILLMGKIGNHNKDPKRLLRNDADIKKHYHQNGIRFDEVVERCRIFSNNVPFYENILLAQARTHGMTVSKVDPSTGKYEPVVEGDGVFNQKDYWNSFDLAVEDFENSIEGADYERFLSAVNCGLSSIEAFLNYQYLHKTSKDHEPEALRQDLIWKFDTWIPQFTKTSFDKSKSHWMNFKMLKESRDNKFQHRKSTASGITYSDMEKFINLFRSGVCRVLLELHLLFNERCPTKIIRYSYYPNIKYSPQTA
jgi:hypothetical protein